MAFLMSAVADAIHDPSGLWELLILKVFKFIGNYGWRILFFTVCLKILLFPLDLYQRIKMRKNQLITERIAPQMEKLQQQYAGDRQMLAQKQMELNRREGFSYFSSCLPLIVTLVIFFYLFSGLNNISHYKNLKQYVELYDAYVAVETVEKDKEYETTLGDETVTLSYNALYIEQINGRPELNSYMPDISGYKNSEDEWGGALGGKSEYNAAVEAAEASHKAALEAWTAENSDKIAKYQNAMDYIENTYVKPKAQDAVVERYEDVKESFLWIGNIWTPDVPWRKEILTHNQFESNVADYKSYSKVRKKLKVKSDELSSAEFSNMMDSTTYNKVTGKLRSEHNRANGYLVLPILSVALSFLSQFISSKLQKQSGQAAPDGSSMAGSMKMMMIIMPLMMGFFALTYTSMFTLYIVVNSTMTILINVFTTLVLGGKRKKKEQKLTSEVQKYGRPDPKDL